MAQDARTRVSEAAYRTLFMLMIFALGVLVGWAWADVLAWWDGGVVM